MSKPKKKISEISPWELPDLPAPPPAGGRPPSGTTMQEITRRDYREPIGDDEGVFADIEGTALPVCDIGSFGLGIIVPSLEHFAPGAICKIALHIGANALAVKGRVTHISPSGKSGKCHCGLEFIELGKKNERTLQNFLADHHARLFSRQSGR